MKVVIRTFLFITTSIFLNFLNPLFAQPYDDYIGAGHSDGITVTSSSEHSKAGWTEVAEASNTIDGDGLEAKLLEASRFLAQASLGADLETIQYVAEIGIENWIEQQFASPLPGYRDTVLDINAQILEWYLAEGGDPEDFGWADWIEFQYSWWQINLLNKDLLRQRVAFALSEILVISFESDLASFGEGLGTYYDILSVGAFSNYEWILRQIALHPMMGLYLSHFNNPKTDSLENIHPDENFARELMQLFTIGLYELNLDGSRKLDSLGNEIPTYDNEVIHEMAKVFTGLGPGEIRENPWHPVPNFGISDWWTNMAVPMAMYEEEHEPGPKYLLNGFITDPSNTGIQDIYDAIHNLFMHPNMGPFLSRRLIQSLVKSNPTPQYIERVATVFNNDGNGIRGNMMALVKAILLDPEARECAWISHESQGKLREPILRYTHIARAMDKLPPDGFFWNIGTYFQEKTGQAPLGAPHVFNFFLPDYAPNGPLAAAGMFGPEFQIHNTRTAVTYANLANDLTFYLALITTWEDTEPVFMDLDNLIPKSKDPEVLINRLDMLFTHGLMSYETRQNIKNTILQMTPSTLWSGYLDSRTRMAFFLTLLSPDYNILR